MFQRGAGGEVTVCDASDALALKMIVGDNHDISATTRTDIMLVDRNDIGIWAVHFLVTTALTAADCDMDVGTSLGATGAGVDVDGIVNGGSNLSLFNDATKLGGSYITPTLATALRGTSFKTGGRPVVKRGEVIASRTYGDSANTGVVRPVIVYFDIEPGV